MNKYLALDPGETTGWATFDENGIETDMGQIKQKDLAKELDRLVTSELELVIVEDYRNHGWMQQKKWGRNQTSKNIGAIEMICTLRNVPVVLQPNTVKAIGYRFAGMPGAPSNHSISHQFDAFAHGVYYLETNNIRTNILQRKNSGSE